MKKTLRLLASAALICFGIQLGTDAYPVRAIRGRSIPNRVNINIQTVPYNYNYPGGDSYYYEQRERVIINRGGGYDSCYGCSYYRNYDSYGSPYYRNYNSYPYYDRGPVYYPNTPFSIYNRRH